MGTDSRSMLVAISNAEQTTFIDFSTILLCLRTVSSNVSMVSSRIIKSSIIGTLSIQPCYFIFHTAPEFVETVIEIHRPREDDYFLTMGAFFLPTKDHPYSMVHAAIVFIIPTLALSYGVFAICVTKSWRELTHSNVKLSKMTISLHRKFLKMMAVQNLLPLVVVSFPMCILIIVSLSGGMPVGLMTFPLSFTLFALPIVQLTCSAISFVIVFYTAIFHLRKSWFEGVFKIIQITKRLTATVPCEMTFDRRFCLLRMLITLGAPSFVLLHAALTLQRILTTFSGNHMIHLIIARTSLAATLLYCIGYMFYGYREYPMEGLTSFCAGFAKGEEWLVLLGYFAMMLADFLNVIVTFALLFYNRKKMHHLSETPLEVKFRYRQTYQSIKQMLPIAFLNLFCCTVQFVGAYYGNSLPFTNTERTIVLGYFYMIPYYCVACPASLLVLMKIEDKKKKRDLKSISSTSSESATNEYFTSLHAQWDSYGPNFRTIDHSAVVTAGVFIRIDLYCHLHNHIPPEKVMETIFALYFFILWHASFMIVLYAIQLWKRVSATGPCDIQFDRKFCILRILITISTPSFVLLHATLTIQRILTTFSGHRILHKAIARVCLLLTLAYGVGYLFIGYRSYLMHGLTSYCSGYSVGEERAILQGYLRMVLIDSLNVFITFILYFYNRAKIRKLSSTPLDVKFRYRQTLQSIQQMLPVAFLNLLCCAVQYFGFMFGLSLFRSLPETHRIILNGFFYTTTYYCVACPAILLLLMVIEKKKKRRELRSISTTSSEEATDEYFSSLQSQWDRFIPADKKA
ncbi:sra-14 [Pristionchus pacificus]|uniref:G protein-coupled receptor n=1 Tax=Pristionchus pacificus TaxID=54126 RepID=A0A2A6CK83_PRIPA|nr:sra-14 [Pristionchus pacificus]|eukprot:PDM78498.1 G protein-coupled receptor [Pristionchus pacificus]